ncbi:MAG: type II secretion system protein [Deltaproteobacteria bacterium]|nr:type II secretion system protein [Deltaproteobacteria bacterium]
MAKQKGFTLIEIIAVLLIVAVVATVSGMAIVTGVKGYLFATDNVSITQKAQMALTRINRELMELADVTSAEQSRVTYRKLDDTTTTLYFSDPDDTINIVSGENPSGGDMLVDRVGLFQLTYYKGQEPWVIGTDDIRDLSTIRIELHIERSEGGLSVTFATRITPRNNKD